MTWYKHVPELFTSKPKKVVLSGPSGFLGSRVLNRLLDIHRAREEHGLYPGEIILLSSSPGRLMEYLTQRYSEEQMKHIRASRVNMFNQHDAETWIDQLGALGAGGEDSVFVNLAAVAGPVKEHPNAMLDVNYHACVASAQACKYLGFGHFVQSSTQATNAERSGQVPYAKHKSMADHALSRRFGDMPVSIASLSLLYSKEDGGTVGQDQKESRRLLTRKGKPVKLNLIDLSLLPLTPIMGSGQAPLQPQEVSDAAKRLAYLALSDPVHRPLQTTHTREIADLQRNNPNLRVYDAVGPENISILELLSRFATYQGKQNFRPVFIDYRRMEEILNVRSLGNLNRQFVSLLRSEQDSLSPPLLGDGSVWGSLLASSSGEGEGEREGEGEEIAVEAQMLTLDQAFEESSHHNLRRGKRRGYPYLKNLLFVYQNPFVIRPGIMLSLEIIWSWLTSRGPIKYKGGIPTYTSGATAEWRAYTRGSNACEWRAKSS